MRFIKNTSHVVNFISSGEGQYQYLSLFVTMSTILITIIIASPIDHNYLYDQILNISQMYLQESETPVNLSCKNLILGKFYSVGQDNQIQVDILCQK